MRIAGFRFVPRLVPTLAAFAMIAFLASLGRWQVGRVEEKETRQALLERRAQEPVAKLTGPFRDAEAMLFRNVVAEGRYLADQQVYIDNRQHQGRAGFHVITPLRIAGSTAAVLVNRGWIARTAAYPAAPAVPVPEGEVRVAGLAARPPARYLELSPKTVDGAVWQNLSIEKYGERMKMEVLPVLVLASPAAPGLARVEEAPDAGAAKHREYSLTWFALALTVLGLWLVLNLRRDA